MAASEGYQQAEPQGPDLASATPERHNRSQRRIALGATAMIVIVAAVIAVLMQPLEQGATVRAPRLVQVDELESGEVSPKLALAFVAESFAGLDTDGSGFVELGEVPGFGLTQGISLPDPQSMSETELQQGRRRWIAVGDRDGDGRVGLPEYLAWLYPASSGAAYPPSDEAPRSAATD